MTEGGRRLPGWVVGADWLASRLDDPGLRVIDARRAGEYSQSHIKGATSFPLHLLLQDEKPERVAQILSSMGVGEGNSVVVYDDYQATHAARLAWALEYIGHRDVALLNVDFSRWVELGLETSRGEPRVEPANHGVDMNPEIRADVDYVKGRLNTLWVVLVDARERMNFLEGHIPKARSMPWRLFVGRETIFHNPQLIARTVEGRGLEGGVEVVTYCGSSGTLSAVALYGLRLAGVGRVRLYDRSLLEWKALKLPLERVEGSHFWDLSG